jgi:hypothetical protein
VKAGGRAAAWGLWLAAAVWGQDRPARGCAEMEAFLRTAKIGVQRETPRGVTLPKRATLEQDGFTHDASIQTVNVTRSTFQGQRRTELNFRDFWGFNVAGYELAKILELNMVPPYVERKVGGTAASVSWWVDDAMLEADRVQKKIQPPDAEAWNQQMYVARVFNQLIGNADPNLSNFLIARDWQVWLIDFSRAFRLSRDLLSPQDLVQCDRKLLARLRRLDRKTLEEKLVRPKFITNLELDGLLARRDKIVAFFDREIAARGEAAVLFDLPRSSQACGAGL